MKNQKVESSYVNILANIYFEGSVQSRTFFNQEGVRKTLGVYLPGIYTFESHEAESVQVTRGEVEILMPDFDFWQKIDTNEIYEVPANCKFQVRCNEIAEYICEFK